MRFYGFCNYCGANGHPTKECPERHAATCAFCRWARSPRRRRPDAPAIVIGLAEAIRPGAPPELMSAFLTYYTESVQ